MAVRAVPLLAALALVAAGAFLWWVPQPPREVTAADGIQVVEHIPSGEPLAVALVLHSVFQSPETAAPVAAALARNGYLAVNVRLEDRGDFGRLLEGARRVYKHYRKRYEVVLWGHSMGADLACSLALLEPSCRATVAVGFPVQAGPSNLLLAVGAWDQLHTRSSMEQAARASGASRLLVLPFSDHAMENFDPLLFEESVRWFDQALNRPSREPAVVVPAPFVARGVCLAAGFILILEVLRRMRFRVLVVTLLMLLREPVLTAASALALVVAQGKGRLRPLGQVLPLALLAYGVGLVLCGFPWLLEYPGMLLGLPVCLAQAPFVYAMKLAEGAVSVALVVPLLEFLLPGGIYELARTLRRARFQVRGRISPVSLGVLGLCLLVALLCWLRVLRAGYLPDPQQALAIGVIFLRALLVPVVVFVLLLRRLDVKGIQDEAIEQQRDLP